MQDRYPNLQDHARLRELGIQTAGFARLCRVGIGPGGTANALEPPGPPGWTPSAGRSCGVRSPCHP